MIAFGAEVRVFVATQPIDFRKGVHGLVALVAEGLGGQPYSGDVFVFRSKRNQQATFCIYFSPRDDCVSLAPAVWPDTASVTKPARQGPDLHLHGRAAGPGARAPELDVRRDLLCRHEPRSAAGQH